MQCLDDDEDIADQGQYSFFLVSIVIWSVFYQWTNMPNLDMSFSCIDITETMTRSESYQVFKKLSDDVERLNSKLESILQNIKTPNEYQGRYFKILHFYFLAL